MAGTDPAGVDYTVTVNAYIDDDTGPSSNADHVLTIINPCTDSSILQLVSIEAPDFTYILYNTTANTWTHSPVSVDTDIDYDLLCGGITYTSDADTTNPLLAFLTYDSDAQSMTIYTEDVSLIDTGPHPYTVTASLTSNPEVSIEVTALITILDPCDDPFNLELTLVPDDVIQTDYSAPAEFLFPTWEVTPSICVPVVFSCRYISGPYSGSLSLCDFSSTNGDYSSSGVLDETNGNYVFTSDDRETFPPGEYNLEIEITAGTRSL